MNISHGRERDMVYRRESARGDIYRLIFYCGGHALNLICIFILNILIDICTFLYYMPIITHI